MNWWGKMVGGAFGFMVGGPFGAMFGAAVGHNFDRNAARFAGLHDGHGHGQGRHGSDAEAEQRFLIALFAGLGAVAKADGAVSAAELEAARAVIGHLRLDGLRREQAMRAFNDGKRADYPLDATLDAFAEVLPQRPELLRAFLEIQLATAWAIGEPHPRARECVGSMAARLGVGRGQLDALELMIRVQRGGFGGPGQGRQQHSGGHQHRQPARPATPPIDEDYRTLGLGRSATDEEVTRAYRRLLSRHHPDKLAAQGLDEAGMKRATERTHAIRSAYERIRSARGFG
ncbi:MAG TPA: co-chaperone DjlA [Plasticicumulans sp.]|nr:co-chaperone DjlA [Plasticicumulans sp.]